MNNVEENGLKKGQTIALLAVLLLNVIWLVCGTLTAIKLNGSLPLYQIVNIIMLIVTVYYAYCGYKKPHGNHIRYLLLCSSAFEAIQYINFGTTFPNYVTAAFFAATILTAYMAGRLDRYKQNVIISAVVLICKAIIGFYFVNRLSELSFVSFMGMMGSVTQWLAITGAYIIRFKLHKEAGLEENK